MSYLLICAFFGTIALISGSSSPLRVFEKNAQSTRDGQAPRSNPDREIARLTDEVIPTAYDLRLVPDLEKFTFIGKVEISIHVKFATKVIMLHCWQLKINSVKLLKTDKSKTPIDNRYASEETDEVLYVMTNQPLNFGTDYTLVIEFEGKIGQNLVGFYRSSYMEGDKEYWLAVTQFEPHHARTAFPCFDEPRFRTPFTIYIAASKNQLVVSNMPLDTQLPSDSISGSNRIWFKFKKSPPMPTYLVGYMVSDFSFVSDIENNVRVISRKDQLQRNYYALGQSTKILKQLEGYLGVAYKMPKMDVVAVPDFLSGGMENWGMVTLRERFVIADQETSSAQHRHIITQIISHEFAHQWFGDLVTPAWHDYLWIKEGFATYFESFATAAIEPTWNLDQLFVIEFVQEAMSKEVYTQRAMTTPIRKVKQFDEIYDIISYEKAGSVIRMFEHMVSSNTFRNALNNFLSKGDSDYEGVVTEKHLLNAFDAESARSSYTFPPQTSVSDIMKSWTRNIGFPLITVARSYDSGTIKITQASYQSIEAAEKLPNQNWIVPLTYTTKNKLLFTNTAPSAWSFADKPTELQETVASTDWILVNLQQTGYYRVNYDTKNWNLLIEQLQQDHEKIHVLNRAQLINDAYSLAYDEHLSYQVALKLTEYLPKETNMIPWYTAIKALKTLNYRAQYTNDEFLKTYFYNLIKSAYEKFGFEIKNTDSHVAKIGKPVFLSTVCELEIEDCIQKSLSEYKTNEEDLTKIQPDLKRVVYCYALRHSKDAQSVFNNLWATYTKHDVSYEKTQILGALACAQDEEVIKKVLSKMIDPTNKEIRKKDRTFFLTHLPWRASSISAVIKFVDEKIPTISELSSDGISLLKELLSSMKYNMKNQDQIQQLNDLETKFTSLDKEKYSQFISILKSAQSTSKNAITFNAEKLQRLSKEFKQSVDDKSDTNTDNDTKGSTPDSTEPSGSGSNILIPKLGWNLFAAVAVFGYSLGVFRV